MAVPKQPLRSTKSEGIGVQNAGGQRAAGSAGVTPIPPAGDDPAAEDRTLRISERVQTLRLEKTPDDLRRRRRRWPWLLLLLLILGVGATLAYQSDVLRGLSGPVEVESVIVTRTQPPDVVLDTTGNVVAPVTVQITPQVSGRVVELNLEVQKKVRKDELLLRIDDQQYRAELEQATAMLSEAQARLDRLTKELKRAEGLKDVIPPAEYDQIEAGRREAQAGVEKAEALVRKAQVFHGWTRICSPIDGTVLQRSVELGEIILIQPGVFAKSIASIADLRQLEVEIEIQERDLAAIRVGQDCLVTPDAYPDRQYRGRLDRLAPTLSRERGSRQANIVLTQPDDWLAANMNCRVQVLREAPPKTKPNVARIPQEAVVLEGERPFVFVAHDGTAQRRSVRLGAAERGAIEVLEGLTDGEEVLLPGDRDLEEGQRVRTRPRAHANHE